jgi:calcineurin-like phosphoesterase family protein
MRAIAGVSRPPGGSRSRSRLAAALVALACGAALATCGGDQGRPREAVLLGAGDIGDCETPGDEATARLLDAHPTATIAVLGDVAYPHGSASDFERCFAPSWGRFRERMRPATGNHDHATADAAGYAAYFGARGGPAGTYRYSYDLGAWHVVVLDSDCWRVGGCALDDPQARWMRADLQRHRARCTLAYWHRPPFSSGRYGDAADTLRVRPLWRVAVEEGVDVVLTAHEHSYERHAPMDAKGRLDAAGTRLFVVGTGGGNLRRYRDPPLPSTEVRNDDTWGVLRLELHPDRYDWRFLPVDARTFSDHGSGACN